MQNGCKNRKLSRLFLIFLIGIVPVVVSAQYRKTHDQDYLMGAQQFESYIPLIKDKQIAIVANQTSLVNGVHLVDTLLALGMDIKLVFAPEHGFRGIADAGQHVKDSKDPKTGLLVKSLYGKHKKPTPGEMDGVEVVLFDIQDVGVRFYTYISTMHYVMEACAENKARFVVLDRPNPNGFYVDGPVLQEDFKSFVGMHQVPLVHGMTIGEYAQMINGEGWLSFSTTCDLTIIPVKGYTHDDRYQLSVKPSPNLPNMESIYLYPSLGLFEGTKISVGRGTKFPFQMIGAPSLKVGNYSFKPSPHPGAKRPKYNGKKCNGFFLKETGDEIGKSEPGVYLNWLKLTYANFQPRTSYFLKSGFFNLLAGTDELKKQIEKGVSVSLIRSSWKQGLTDFLTIRSKYLLYSDVKEVLIQSPLDGK